MNWEYFSFYFSWQGTEMRSLNYPSNGDLETLRYSVEKQTKNKLKK